MAGFEQDHDCLPVHASLKMQACNINVPPELQHARLQIHSKAAENTALKGHSEQSAWLPMPMSRADKLLGDTLCMCNSAATPLSI